MYGVRESRWVSSGRASWRAMDIAFGLRKDATGSNYIKDLKQRLDHAYTVASEASKKSQLRQKEGYDTKVRGATIQKGDRVLVKIVAFGEGKHKLADKWEHDPYTVLAQPNADIPVFTVQKENGDGRKRNLHRNLLLPIGYLTDTEPPVQRGKPVPKPRLKKKQTTPVTSIRPESQGVHSDESSDEEPLELVIVEHDASSDTTITEEQHDDSTVTDTTEDSDSDGTPIPRKLQIWKQKGQKQSLLLEALRQSVVKIVSRRIVLMKLLQHLHLNQLGGLLERDSNQPG
ncbi:Hypothetical predicted protein [Mytilus galloprovincialis]|uniref:Uncharacterized protein n=1 Tax=Mytilus galloprovincialis TaxID=29158 RepID=A0A8B6D0P2_MYTGA|nr:Hypothetical predicted protein [Mytilus galloprovincialis]